MEVAASNQPRTKQCACCAETIQAQAVKCRFCGEFLNTRQAKALETGLDRDFAADNLENMLYEGRPSLFAMAPAAIKGLFFLTLAACLIKSPLQNTPIGLF